MRNIQFKQLYKLLKKDKSHSGFTLMELLSGVVMSTLVIGGLGYGLFQLTRVTGDEAGKVKARDESSRAIQFISDELRRAQEVVDIDSPTFTIPGGVPAGGTIRLALNIPGLDNPVIYYTGSAAGTEWQGDLVLYRWGPPYDENGAYTDETWVPRALLDGLDGENQNINCNGSPITYQGFYACRRLDGITAQLYFTSGIDIANTEDDKEYTAETQVVARARVSDHDNAEERETTPISFRTLGAEYSLGTIGGVDCNGETTWTMRNDFFNDPQGSSPSYTPTTWIHDPDRQGQQIDINPENPLTISSIPFLYSDDYSNCTGGPILSRGNETGVEGNPILHEEVPGSGDDNDTWIPQDADLDGEYDFETSDFTIDFSDKGTFNGNELDNPVPMVDGQEVDHVRIFRKGSVIEYIKDSQEITLDGYDDDSTGTPDDGEYSLGEFLAYKGYAVETETPGKYRLVIDTDLVNGEENQSPNPFLSEDPDSAPTLKMLEDKERIIAIEIGQVETGPKFEDGVTINPGFDLQDNIVLVSVDAFASHVEGESH